MIKTSTCVHCKAEIHYNDNAIQGINWYHERGMARCDGVSSKREGFEQAKKATPALFKEYLRRL